jgi:hypothetical protein
MLISLPVSADGSFKETRIHEPSTGDDMTGKTSVLAALLTECDAHGIRLSLTSDRGLTIDAPQSALTPDPLDRLKANKADVLALLGPETEETLASPLALSDTPAKGVCRCGSTTWRDVPIHGGQSIRRDSGRCGRFLDFPVWHQQRHSPPPSCLQSK